MYVLGMGGFFEPIAHFEGRELLSMLPKALSLKNETRPYKSAHEHDMSCPLSLLDHSALRFVDDCLIIHVDGVLLEHSVIGFR